MTDLDALLRKGVADGEAPFLVAMSGNAEGVTWSGAAGERSPGVAATVDTVFRIFSMTKAIGSTAAMMLIDRGKLSMDTEIETVLPEFSGIQVLEGIEGGKPILRAPRTKATVRHLATHTSGFVYEFWNSMIPSYMEIAGHPTIISGLNAALNYPLAFDPGERWDYGIGIDWLGRVVEAVDGRSIDRFCHDEIFEPLSMADTGFEVVGSMADRLASVRARGEDGSFVDFELSPPSNPEFYGMGHALYSTAPDYMRFLRMFLNRGELDGHRILSEGGLDHMLANQIGDLRVGLLKTAAPPVTADAEFFPGREKTHSFGFMRMEEDVPGMRTAGSQAWAGVLNTHFWFDPNRDVAGLIMTQMLPFADPAFIRLYERYEAAVYGNLSS
jgi:CubicO group peptidase (beta-lactamase class C family)